ncbi:MAG: nucleotidyltransferase domain-containing protein [Muribaculaceae bacterium]|nr:nucleotidyltransferase domain-containing protein [Muribaculaceae bacterium]
MCNINDCITKLRENIPYIQKEYGVTGLCLFGSVARGDNRPDSDVDILVDMPPKIFALTALHRFLENLLQSSVDLIRRHSHLSTQFLDQVSRDGIKIL